MNSKGETTFTISQTQAIAVALLFGLSLGFIGASLGGGSPLDTVGAFFSEEPEENADSNVQRQVEVDKIETEGEPVLGDKDAEITMVVYEDYQCPYCKRFEENTVSQVESNYVDSGDVKVIWKDFPIPQLGHDWAVPAAETMECVYRQDNDAFWSLKDQIYANQDTLNSMSPDAVQDEILTWASEDVDRSEVEACLENGNPETEVNGDLREGQSFNAMVKTPKGDREFVSGTPGTVIFAEGDEMGKPVVGAQPYSVFESIISSKMG